uniref:Nodal modulator 1 (inferred by orthology to a human protein) n=1 Tax=Strongyloides venezuelensis TaxID=75913 RepID=A0A0K0FSC7_STRVS
MCTGFVKSPFKIDTNKIKINLLTENNLLKERNNIVPYNGFFAIPIYNKGKYILKVDSESNIFFDPPFYELDLQDFDNNVKNKEYTFNGLGYEIKGKVEGLIDNDRVAIKLESLDGEVVKMETVNNFGEFHFISPPGEYSISVLTSQSACFHKSQYIVNIVDNSVEIPITYVSGFFIMIHINDLNNLNPKIKFQISSNKKLSMENCISVLNDNSSEMYECTTETVTQLPHIIKCLPKGKYTIRPVVIEDNGISFSPHEKKIEIDNHNVNIYFEIEGFKAYGKTEVNGIPIGDVKIYGNNKHIATSDNEGKFIWNNAKKGKYKMEAKKDGIIFTSINATLNVNQPTIQPFNVTKFRVSGQVILENNKTEKIYLSIESLIINARLSIRTNEQGKFLIFLPVGNYSITINDKKHGFVPGTHIVTFKDKPQDNVVFSKVKIDIIVVLKLFHDQCKDIVINLKDETGNINEKKNCTSNQIIFNNYSPGIFIVSVDDEKLYCWKENDIRKHVASNSDNKIQFLQTGYNLRLNSPIETDLNVINMDSNISYPISLKYGINMLCVPEKGNYKISNNACYIFNDSSFQLSLHKNSIKHIVVKEILINVGIEMVDIFIDDPLHFNVKMINNRDWKEKIYSSKVKSNKEHVLEFYVDSEHEKNLFLITPIFKDTIVEPKSIEINFDKNCDEKKSLFKIYKGYFVNGKILSYVNGVEVKYVDENNTTLKSFVNEDGTFRIGPIKKINDDSLFLIKERFKFKLLSKDGIYLYKTIELSTLRVEFKNNQTDEHIKDVMVTIFSESSYLIKNLASKGILEITNLEAGNYIITPFRQEYRFYNTSIIVTTETGKLTTLTVYGTQFSYSIFGKINYLNNDPIPNKNIHAISGDCNSLEEVGLTNNSGEYRIPNLHPLCTYKITVKNDKNTNFYTIPKEYRISIKDSPVHDINFIYYKLPNHQLEVYVKVDLIDIPKQNFIQVGIYREKDKTAVFKKLLSKEQSSFFVPKLPLENKTYIIKIDKISDNRIKYQYNSGLFTTNATFQFIKIVLEPQKFSPEVGVPPENVVGLIIIGLIVIIFFNTENIRLFIIFLIDYWKYSRRNYTVFEEEKVYIRRR